MENPNIVTNFDYKVIILGAGAAGIRTAIELKKNNISCLLISKRKHDDAHTKMAAGGINASLGSLDPDDNWKIHAADTIREGYFINDPSAVEVVCKQAPEAVLELQKWGCKFNLTEDGKINQRFFGAQSFRRTCFSGDETGKEILRTLVAKAKAEAIEHQEGIYIFKILKSNERITGALGYDMVNEQFVHYLSPVVVIACGGYASVYSRSSSRQGENTGDSISLALQAGARVMDMEMVQFHPTGMVSPQSYLGKLVTEAVRGEGGILVNKTGERFMEKYAPEQMELATRDEVARAIAKEILEGRGTKNSGVFLDISHKDKDFIKDRLPHMYERFSGIGIDISKKPMEVAPTSHYSMGGIEVDFTTGSTGVKGLYAVGEATAGLHGANRLGGNSLAETIVLGKITGNSIAEYLTTQATIEKKGNDTTIQLPQFPNYLSAEKLIKDVKELLWLHAGIIRSQKILEEGLEKLEKIQKNLKGHEQQTEFNAENFLMSLDLHNIMVVAELILKSALERKESRGAHFREDFPEERKHWCKNILWGKTQAGYQISSKDIPEVGRDIKEVLEAHYRLDYHQLE
ncbi:FAD-binding protein [Cytophagaceae bacterium ABcell3]|nr:FAD-binding protein [Cytophagaceae bacterium ABcell3]